MKNVFLDCGSHYGQGLTHFIEIFKMTPDKWNIYTFEANPTTYQYLQQASKTVLEKYKVSHFNKAVCTYNGKITINEETPVNEPNTGMGSSIISLDKWNPWNGTLRENFKTTSEVDCFDFSSAVKKLQGSKILVKMDIEGAEYDVLEKMIEDDTLKFITALFIEFHADFFTNKEEIKQREAKIIEKLRENNVNLVLWG